MSDINSPLLQFDQIGQIPQLNAYIQIGVLQTTSDYLIPQIVAAPMNQVLVDTLSLTGITRLPLLKFNESLHCDILVISQSNVIPGILNTISTFVPNMTMDQILYSPTITVQTRMSTLTYSSLMHLSIEPTTVSVLSVSYNMALLDPTIISSSHIVEMPLLSMSQQLLPLGILYAKPLQWTDYQICKMVREPNNPNTTNPWVDVPKALHDDSQFASILTHSCHFSENKFLSLQNPFDQLPALPPASVIKGIAAWLDVYADDVVPKIQCDFFGLTLDGTIPANSKSIIDDLPVISGNFIAGGGSSDLWGYSAITPQQMSSPNFGVMFHVAGGVGKVRVDNAKIAAFHREEFYEDENTLNIIAIKEKTLLPVIDAPNTIAPKTLHITQRLIPLLDRTPVILSSANLIVMTCNIPILSQPTSITGPMQGQVATLEQYIGVESERLPNNALTSDGLFADWQANVPGNPTRLHIKNPFMGSSIPNNARITGMVVKVKRYGDQVNISRVIDSEVRLLINNVPVGSNKATRTPWHLTSETKSYGSPHDKWMITPLTGSEINSPNFGISLGVEYNRTDPNYIGTPIFRDHIDQVTFTAYWRIFGPQYSADVPVLVNEMSTLLPTV